MGRVGSKGSILIDVMSQNLDLMSQNIKRRYPLTRCDRRGDGSNERAGLPNERVAFVTWRAGGL
jgi:hypothetical protein